MSKISKLLAVLLALVMVVAMFAGCAPTVDPTEPNDTKGSESKVDNSVQWPLAETYTIKLAVNGSKDFNALLAKCEWYKDLVKKTNVKLDVIALGDDPMTKLGTMIADKNLPDAILGGFGAFSDAKVVDLADLGHLIPLEDYLLDETLMPNYNNRLLSEVPEAVQKMTTTDGSIYSVARIAGVKGSYWESPLSYNTKWLKQVPGYEDGSVPGTIEEFTEVLKYYRDHDMNGNGDTTDEIPMLTLCSMRQGDNNGGLQGIMNWWGLPTKDSDTEYYVVITDGVCELAPTMDAYRDCLEVMNEWYEEGLLWDEFFSNVDRSTHLAVANSELDVWGFYNGSQYQNVENTTYAWGKDIEFMVPPETGYDCRYFINPGYTGYKNCFSITTACEKPEIVMAWLDNCYSLEGSWSLNNGVEDEETRYEGMVDMWTAKDGKIINNIAAGTVEQLTGQALEDRKADHPFMGEILGSIMYGYAPSEFASNAWPTETTSVAYIKNDWINQKTDLFNKEIWPRPYYTVEQTEEISPIWADIKNICTLWEAAFIKGEKEINDTNWAAYQKELEDARVEDLVDILQEAYDASIGK